MGLVTNEARRLMAKSLGLAASPLSYHPAQANPRACHVSRTYKAHILMAVYSPPPTPSWTKAALMA